MGGLESNSCNNLTKEIWTYYTDQKIWLSTVHIPGKGNHTADYMSRLLNENREWRLAPFVFHKIVKVTPEIDQARNQARRCIWGHDSPLVEHSLVPNDGLTSPGFPCNSSTKHPSITIQSRSATSTPSENETAGSSFISKSLRHPNIPPEITDVILELWRPTTSLKYESVLRRWHSFAISRNENPCSPDVTAVLAFLHGMYHNGCLYSGLCAARSALSSLITTKGYLKLSDHPLISRYLKGIYNRHPPLPKYVDIWDLTLFLKYYEQKENNDCLEFKELVKKTVMLFIILGAYRKQGSIYIKCWLYCF